MLRTRQVNKLACKGDKMLVVDSASHRASVWSMVEDKQLCATGGAGEAAGSLLDPRGGCFLGKEEFLIADTGNSRLQRFSTESGHCTGEIPTGKLKRPVDACVLPGRAILVLDQFSSTIGLLEDGVQVPRPTDDRQRSSTILLCYPWHSSMYLPSVCLSPCLFLCLSIHLSVCSALLCPYFFPRQPTPPPHRAPPCGWNFPPGRR